MEPPSPSDLARELKRLEILAEYALLDTPAEECFDELTKEAALRCGTPTALLTLVDKDRQWFKSRFNFPAVETPREVSFCAYAILQPTGLVVPNALNDPRFAGNPLVVSEPHIRFYAGAPLVDPEGHALGTLCIIDYTPRTLTTEEDRILRSLSRQAMANLELRRRTRALDKATAVIAQQERAAKALQESERLFHTLAKAAPVGIFRTDAKGDCVYVNDRWSEISGLTAEAARGSGWMQTLHPEDREWVLAHWYGAAKSGTSFSAEYRFLRADGHITWVLGQGLKEQSETGELKGYVGTITDISERKQAEDRLRSSEELLRRVMNSSEDCINILDLEGRNVWMNDCGQRGMEIEDFASLLGKSWKEFWPGDGRSAAEAALAAAKGGQPGKFTALCPTAKGEPRWRDVVVTPLLDGGGKPEKILSVSRDITERRRTERLLDWEKSALELISTPSPLAEVLNGVVSGLEAHLTDSICSVLLLEEEGRYARHVAAPSLPATFRHAIDGSLIGPRAGSCGRAMDLNQRVIVADIAADPLWIDYRELALAHGLRACWSTPLRRSTGQVMGSFAIYYTEPRGASPAELELIDRATHIVSIAIERKEAEEAQRLSSERLQLVARATNDAVWDWDLITDKRWWNEGFQTLFGYAPHEIESGVESWTNRLHPSDASRVKEGIFGVIDHGGASWKDEYRFRRQDGSYADIFDRGYILHDAAGKPVRMIGAMIDISERKRTEEALKTSEERFRQLAENITEVFWVTDTTQNQMLYVSPAYTSIWGRTCDSLYHAPQMWLESVHPDDRAHVIEARRTKQISGDYDETYRIVRPEGTVRWIRDRAYPVRSSEGKIYRVVGIAEDITERKTMEAQFLQAQRMETVGRLAGGVAHDINNILAPIMMGVSLLRMGMDPSEAERTLNMIESSAQRGADVVKQLLLFRRGLDGKRTLVRLPELMEEIAKIVQKTFLKSIGLKVALCDDVWPIFGDATQLHQVLLNLCVNARDAMPDGGELSLQIQNIELGPKLAEKHPEAPLGPYVLLSVRDTGLGIPPEIVGRIFDPFFTTKPIGQGTGLGLSTVLGIVRGHGGFVTVQSQPGRGSNFDIYLPASPGSMPSDSGSPLPLPPRGKGELILVVDDEEYIRETLSRTLVLHGYTVKTASDGAEAIDLFVGLRDEIKVVITDIDMPSMDGPSMLRLLRGISPQLSVIVSSGIGGGTMSSSRSAELKALGVTTFLAKPYTAEKVLRLVHRLLIAPSSPERNLSSNEIMARS